MSDSLLLDAVPVATNEIIIELKDGSKYKGYTILIDENQQQQPGKKQVVPHGWGRCLKYPYLYIGEWNRGNLNKSTMQLYYHNNCDYGEFFDFEKQRNGQMNNLYLLNKNQQPDCASSYSWLTLRDPA
jgi:hypothetical protein